MTTSSVLRATKFAFAGLPLLPSAAAEMLFVVSVCKYGKSARTKTNESYNACSSIYGRSMLVIQHRQSKIFHIVLALRATRGFAGGLDSRQQKRDEDPNNRYHDQQFD